MMLLLSLQKLILDYGYTLTMRKAPQCLDSVEIEVTNGFYHQTFVLTNRELCDDDIRVLEYALGYIVRAIEVRRETNKALEDRS